MASFASPEVAAAAATGNMHTENFTVDMTGGLTALGNLIVMDRSVYVWLGGGGGGDVEPSMGSLSTAIPTRFDAAPLTTTLLSPPADGDDFGNELAQRLAQRFGIQVFVSCNFSGELQEQQRRELDTRLIDVLGVHFAVHKR